MKTQLFVFICLIFSFLLPLKSQETSLLQFPEVVNLTAVSETEPGIFAGIGVSYTGAISHLNVVKMNTDEEVLWMTELIPNIFYSNRNLYELDDDNLMAVNGPYVYILNSDGEILYDHKFVFTDLDYTPIAGDLEIANFISSAQNADGIILLSNGTYLTPEYNTILTITQISNTGELLWCKAYPLPGNYDFRDITLFEDKAFVHAQNNEIYEPVMMIIDNLTGEITSELILPEFNYYSDIITVHDGVIQYGVSYIGLTSYDDINKISPDGEVVFQKSYENSPSDSIESIIFMTELASNTLVSLNRIAIVPFTEYKYVIRHYDPTGEIVYESPTVLNCDQFSVYHFAAIENYLIYSGAFYDLLGESVGFVLVTDSIGSFNNLIVNGTVYFDENENGILDLSESPMANRLLLSDPTTYTNSSDSLGFYSHHFYEFGSYDFSAVLPEYWDVVMPENYTVTHDLLTTGSTLIDHNFGISFSTPVTELITNVQILSDVRPGLTVPIVIDINNLGNQTIAAGVLTFQFYSGLSYSSGTPYTSLTDTTLTFTYPEMEPFENKLFYVNLTASEDLTIGDFVSFNSNTGEVPFDILPENNVDTIVLPVVNSFDPNDKTADPVGEGPEGFIDVETQYLEYTITFQNIGTAPAIDVKIIDTLNSAIDPNSIQILSAKHNYHFEINNGNVVTWNFDDIYLPDSASQPIESIGFVTYRVKLNAGLPIGTVIENTAGIYFDFNDPIITNTTINTLKDLKNTILDVKYPGILTMYPNPAHQEITIESDLEYNGVVIKNMMNQNVLTLNELSTGRIQQISLGSLPAGIYFVNTFINNDQNGAGKISIIK